MQSEAIQLEVMSELRQRTRTEHLALEQRLPFFHPSFSLEQYISLLERFFGVFEPLETAIDFHLRTVSHATPPRISRTSLIREDLYALGKSDAAIAALPRCANLPTIQSIQQALGCFYVLEGSMLGGQLISRELRDKFEIGPDTGASFFSSQGIDVKFRWLQDQQILRANLDSRSALEATVSSANATFRTFKHWLTTSSLPNS